MKKIALLAAALLMGAAHAANVSGKQTTPLTLKVNNVCLVAYTTPKYFNGAAGLDKTYSTVDLGTINAITNKTTSNVMVMSADCNKNTVLNITTPTKVTFTSGENTFDMTTDTWDEQHPFVMSFTNGRTGQIEYTHGPYNYYERIASFRVGGPGSGENRSWSIPGGTYTGDLVVTFNYDE